VKLTTYSTVHINVKMQIYLTLNSMFAEYQHQQFVKIAYISLPKCLVFGYCCRI